jgi:hypothetical protein
MANSSTEKDQGPGDLTEKALLASKLEENRVRPSKGIDHLGSPRKYTCDVQILVPNTQGRRMNKKFTRQCSIKKNYNSSVTLESTPGLTDTTTVQGPTPLEFQIVTRPSHHFSNNPTGANTPNIRASMGSPSNMSPLNGSMNAVAKLAIEQSNKLSVFNTGGLEPQTTTKQTYNRLSIFNEPPNLKTVPENGSSVDFEPADGILEFARNDKTATPQNKNIKVGPRPELLRSAIPVLYEESETINIKSPSRVVTKVNPDAEPGRRLRKKLMNNKLLNLSPTRMSDVNGARGSGTFMGLTQLKQES